MEESELTAILNSGEVGSIYLGNTNQGDRVLKSSEIEALTTDYGTDIAQNTEDIAANKAEIEANDTDILALQTTQGDHGTYISQNALDIAQNTADITAAEDAIVANTLVINENTTKVDGIILGTQEVEKTTYKQSTQFDIDGLSEGQVAYDTVAKTLVVRSDIADQTLNVGQESLIRVGNYTGTTIPNGSVLTIIGVQNGVPSVGLAQADDYDGARIVGMATHDIPTSTEGYSTAFGNVGDVPTNQGGETWAIGETVFLSDTIPGGMTNVLPAIGTVVGAVLTNNGTTGTIFVKPNSLITLPPIGGWQKAIPTTIAPGAAYQNFVNFTDVSTSSGIAGDGTAGTYTFGIPGTYEMSLSVTLAGMIAQTNGSIVNIQLWNQTAASELFEYSIIVGRNDTVASGTMITQGDFSEGDVLVARYSEVSGDVGGAVEVSNISFVVKSILVR